MTHPDPSRAPEMKAGLNLADVSASDDLPSIVAAAIMRLPWAKGPDVDTMCDRHGDVQLAVEAILSRADTPAGAGGDVVTVPVEPTEAMLNAPLLLGPNHPTGNRYESRRDLRPHIYRAMIRAAAPQAEGAER